MHSIYYLQSHHCRKTKAKLGLTYLSIAIVSLDKHTNIDWFQSFLKNQLFKKIPLNVLGNKFDLDVKQGQHRIIIWANLVALHPKCYIPSPKVIDRPSGSGDGDFKGFEPYIGMAAILVM